MRRCSKKNHKKQRTLALGNSKCMQFSKAVKEDKGPWGSKGGLGEGRLKGKMKHKGEELAWGGGFVVE